MSKDFEKTVELLLLYTEVGAAGRFAVVKNIPADLVAMGIESPVVRDISLRVKKEIGYRFNTEVAFFNNFWKYWPAVKVNFLSNWIEKFMSIKFSNALHIDFKDIALK